MGNKHDKHSCEELHEAVRAQDINQVRTSIEAGVDINVYHDGRTALIAALDHCNTDLLTLLLKAGADVNMADVYGRTPLHEAAWYGKQNMVGILLKAGADVSIAVYDGRKPFYRSTVHGYKDLVTIIFKDGVNTTYHVGRTPLHLAVFNGHSDIVELLVNAGADVDIADDKSWTPLIYSTQITGGDSMKLLLQAGANVIKADKFGRTPLNWAAWIGKSDMVEMLLTAGGDINIADHAGRTPLHEAACNAHKDVMEMLLQYGARFDIANADGHTPLYLVMREVIKGQWDPRLPTLCAHGACDLLQLQAVENMVDDISRIHHEICWLPEVLQIIRLSGSHYQDYRQVVSPLHLPVCQSYKEKMQECQQKDLNLKESARVVIRRQLCQVGDGASIWKPIDCLEMPSQLKDYLKMREFCQGLMKQQS